VVTKVEITGKGDDDGNGTVTVKMKSSHLCQKLFHSLAVSWSRVQQISCPELVS